MQDAGLLGMMAVVFMGPPIVIGFGFALYTAFIRKD